MVYNKGMNSPEITHFIGIGGIGVSALAKYHISRGANTSGSDLSASSLTEELEGLGTKIFIGKHKKANLPAEAKKVIYSSAASKENPELKEAFRRGLKTRSYAEALGELTKSYKTITVSGAHGKSTTTALAALVLEEGQFDPTVIVGTKLNEFGDSNFRAGQGSYLLLEADEWNKSFLNYHPQAAIVTNIDAEHLDTYKNVEEVEDTFARFLSRVPRQGVIIANADDERLKNVAKKFGKKVVWYSLQDREAAVLRKILRVHGEHNVSNALAALKLGRLLGIHEPVILRALGKFIGAWRRFEFKGIANGAFIFNDYAHHPREIQATLVAARSRFPFRRIWCVYQPHQYQRLAYLWDDFVGAFDAADRVSLLPVYDVAGRETKDAKHKVNSTKLTAALSERGKNVCYHSSFSKAKRHIGAHSRPGDVIMVMGAGDIYKLADNFCLDLTIN